MSKIEPFGPEEGFSEIDYEDIEDKEELIGKVIPVKCRHCGERVEMEWSPGVKCPTCNSHQFFPVIKVDGIITSEKDVRKLRKREERELEEIKPKPRRDWRKSKLLLYISIAIIVLAWVKIIHFIITSRLPPLEPAQRVYWIYTCTHCGESFHAAPAIPPIRCPHCKQKKGFQLYECQECKERFPFELERLPVCPNCESRKVKILRYKPPPPPES